MSTSKIEIDQDIDGTDNHSGDWAIGITPKSWSQSFLRRQLIIPLAVARNVISSFAIDPFLPKRWEDDLVLSANISTYVRARRLISPAQAVRIAMDIQREADNRRHQHATEESEALSRLLSSI